MQPLYKEAAKPGAGLEKHKGPHPYQFALGRCKVQASDINAVQKKGKTNSLAFVSHIKTRTSCSNPNSFE